MKLEFKSILTYDHNVDSDKENFTQPSLTDPSEYEPLESLLARCLRGDFSKVVSNDGGFDENASDDEILADLQPQEMESFDISDRTELDHLMANAVKKEKIKKGAKAPEASVPEKSKTEDPISEAKPNAEEPKA